MTLDGQAQLDGPAQLDETERAAVEAELRCLADDEFVVAERYTEWQVRGPTLEADIAIANMAQDELGHARLWYDLLEGFGYDETELIWERDPGTFRHSTLVEQPFETGDWADCLVRGLFYDEYEHLRLAALADSAYRPIADRVEKVRREEAFHREHAKNWLERLCEDAEGRRRVQSAVDRLFPHALTLFEATEFEEELLELRIRSRSLDELREEWLATVGPFLAGLGTPVPDGLGTDVPDGIDAPVPDGIDAPVPDGEDDQLLPTARGRDGTHTDAWEPVYEAFTANYHMLERNEARRLMPRPEEDVDV